mmetsp:Transcript_60835/g.111327  ORF Transcript_60835/g.111327 Transcript_60835/m.111327 type:complete len:233 (-) Transcript_60835:30-728(-)
MASAASGSSDGSDFMHSRDFKGHEGVELWNIPLLVLDVNKFPTEVSLPITGEVKRCSHHSSEGNFSVTIISSTRSGSSFYCTLHSRKVACLQGLFQSVGTGINHLAHFLCSVCSFPGSHCIFQTTIAVRSSCHLNLACSVALGHEVVVRCDVVAGAVARSREIRQQTGHHLSKQPCDAQEHFVVLHLQNAEAVLYTISVARVVPMALSRSLPLAFREVLQHLSDALGNFAWQ